MKKKGSSKSRMSQKRSRLKVKRRGLDPAFRSFIPLVEQLVEVQKRMKKLGLFIEDRELLTCPKCGLQEDVTFSGMLAVTMPPHQSEDTGLRFKTVKRRANSWRCPACKAEFAAPEQL